MAGRDPEARGKARRGDRLFIICCVSVFLVIAACAAYFVVTLMR